MDHKVCFKRESSEKKNPLSSDFFVSLSSTGSLWWLSVNSRKLSLFWCSALLTSFPYFSPHSSLILFLKVHIPLYFNVVFSFLQIYSCSGTFFLYVNAFSLEFLTQTHSFDPLQMYISAYFCVLCLFIWCR